MREVVITGFGCLSPNGNNKQEFYNSLAIGRSGIGKLDENFRANFNSNLPALFLIGDRDGRTFMGEQLQTAKQFHHAKKILIKGGGHDSFLTDSQVIDAVQQFFNGKLKKIPSIHLNDPAFNTL